MPALFSRNLSRRNNYSFTHSICLSSQLTSMVTISATQISFNGIYLLNSLNTSNTGILDRPSLLAMQLYYFICLQRLRNTDPLLTLSHLCLFRITLLVWLSSSTGITLLGKAKALGYIITKFSNRVNLSRPNPRKGGSSLFCPSMG